jgi:putative redox protein
VPRSHALEFPGALGATLSARMDEPDGETRAHAVFAHCFSGSKDWKGVRRICRALVDEGIAVLTFDFTGLGSSGGDFADTSFSTNVDDVALACAFLAERHAAPDVLIGHSLGGAAVLAAAHRIPAIRALATIGAPSDPEHLVKTLGEAALRADAEGEAEVKVGGRPLTIRRAFLEDLRTNDVRDRIAALGRPLLIFHSPVDEIVSIDEARLLYRAAKHPKSFVSLDGADHLLQRDAKDAEFVARVLAAWAARYLPEDAGHS